MRWQQLFDEICARAYGLEEDLALHADTEDQVLVVSFHGQDFDVAAYRTKNKNWETLFSENYNVIRGPNPAADQVMVEAILRAALILLDTDRSERGGRSPGVKLEYWMSTGGKRWKKERLNGYY